MIRLKIQQFKIYILNACFFRIVNNVFILCFIHRKAIFKNKISNKVAKSPNPSVTRIIVTNLDKKPKQHIRWYVQIFCCQIEKVKPRCKNKHLKICGFNIYYVVIFLFVIYYCHLYYICHLFTCHMIYFLFVICHLFLFIIYYTFMIIIIIYDYVLRFVNKIVFCFLSLFIITVCQFSFYYTIVVQDFWYSQKTRF